MTRSEQFVFDLSQAACLKLWTYASPLGKEAGKELCDVLVVCQPDIVILSVKESELKTGGDPKVQAERWKRRAVSRSVEQVYGAERHLAAVDEVTASDGSVGVQLGPRDSRRVHRVAVAIGAHGDIPLESGDFGKGFVHVFDEESLFLLLDEFDTITDFTDYLVAREAFFLADKPTIIASEEDLVAYYIGSEHSFASLLDRSHHLKIILGAWDEFTQSPAYRNKKLDDQISYVWDRLITQVHTDYLNGFMEFGGDLDSIDAITRAMARETRFMRRVLSSTFEAFMGDPKTESRIILNRGATTHYVLLKHRHTDDPEDRKFRVAELSMRCFVLRDTMDKEGLSGVIIGIATEMPEVGSGFSLDCTLLDIPTWDDDARAKAEELRTDFGYFKNPRMTPLTGQEYRHD